MNCRYNVLLGQPVCRKCLLHSSFLLWSMQCHTTLRRSKCRLQRHLFFGFQQGRRTLRFWNWFWIWFAPTWGACLILVSGCGVFGTCASVFFTAHGVRCCSLYFLILSQCFMASRYCCDYVTMLSIPLYFHVLCRGVHSFEVTNSKQEDCHGTLSSCIYTYAYVHVQTACR